MGAAVEVLAKGSGREIIGWRLLGLNLIQGLGFKVYC